MRSEKEAHLIETYKKLVEALDAYIKELGNELGEIVPLAAVHGWESKRGPLGIKMRKEIAALRKDVQND